MTTDLRTAAHLALESLEEIGDEWGFTSKHTLNKRFEAVEALRSALQEPVEKTTGNLVHIKLNIMRTALKNIAGIRPIVNNLLSDKDIARIALERIDRYEHPTSIRPTS